MWCGGGGSNQTFCFRYGLNTWEREFRGVAPWMSAIGIGHFASITVLTCEKVNFAELLRMSGDAGN